MRNILKNNKGSGIAEVLIGAFVLVFILLPIFSFIIEKQIVGSKIQIIKDSVDMTNLATYNALNSGKLSRNSVEFDDDRVINIYRKYLALNLNLNADLSPKADSIAQNTVEILGLNTYMHGLPVNCPNGVVIERPTVHAVVKVPIKPMMYRQIVLNAVGKQYVDLVIHVDTEIPVNN